jgi:hypothetical protein
MSPACSPLQVDDKPYASYRVMIRFNSTNSTEVRDMMFSGIGSGVAGPCTGGYNQWLFANVAALWAKGQFKVSQNSEWHTLHCISDMLK